MLRKPLRCTPDQASRYVSPQQSQLPHSHGAVLRYAPSDHHSLVVVLQLRMMCLVRSMGDLNPCQKGLAPDIWLQDCV